MTLEEICVSLRMRHTVEGAIYCDVSPEMGEQIIAALRAGQAMRDKLNGATGQVYWGESVTIECDAWDAALGEEK